jgi:hypothetical protein
MPGIRSKDQTVASFSLPSQLLEEVNKVCLEKGLNRSHLLREALAEKLRGMGIALPGGVTRVPSRIQVKAERGAAYLLNEEEESPVPPVSNRPVTYEAAPKRKITIKK